MPCWSTSAGRSARPHERRQGLLARTNRARASELLPPRQSDRAYASLRIRRVADRVNADVRTYRVSHAIKTVWPTCTELLAVCVSADRSQESLSVKPGASPSGLRPNGSSSTPISPIKIMTRDPARRCAGHREDGPISRRGICKCPRPRHYRGDPRLCSKAQRHQANHRKHSSPTHIYVQTPIAGTACPRQSGNWAPGAER